jgi:two-component system response regulator AtoC
MYDTFLDAAIIPLAAGKEPEGAMAKPVILVVDDDDSTRRYLCALLSSLGYEVEDVESGEVALGRMSTSPPAVVLLDLLLPVMSGLEVLDKTRERHPEIPVVVLSTQAEIKTIVDAVRRGASDYLTKPFDEQQLELAVQGALEKREVREEVRILRRRLNHPDSELVSSNPAMVRIRDIARQVADTDAPVLLLGESGVGKEVLARYVHGQSRRSRQAFVKVNCAALPEDLLESELFGYERGAFSGALRDKPGMFELADGGTILLDEIGEMTPQLQAKLLHVLQDGQFTRLGGRQRIQVDARVIAATNIQLEEAVRAGRFRQDLYFRLNVIRIDIPPLRDRRDDIPMLCAHFLRSYTARYRSPLRELPRPLRDAFLRCDWPGNVRELENAVRRYVILPDVELALASLGSAGWDKPASSAAPAPAPAAPRAAEPVPAVERRTGDVSLRSVAAQAAEDAERQLLRRALAETRWNRKEAASLLRISYKALLNKLKKWEVDDPGAASRQAADPNPLRGSRALSVTETLASLVTN